MKKITVTFKHDGTTAIDLDGFHGQGCEKVFETFAKEGKTLSKKKKPVFYEQQTQQQAQKN